MSKPEPISKFIVCSECGLPWEDHTEFNKTHKDCIRLLKLELAKKPIANWQWYSGGSPNQCAAPSGAQITVNGS